MLYVIYVNISTFFIEALNLNKKDVIHLPPKEDGGISHRILNMVLFDLSHPAISSFIFIPPRLLYLNYIIHIKPTFL